MVIENDTALDAALRRIDELWQAQSTAPEGDRLVEELDALVNVVAAYEEKRCPIPA